MWVPLARVWVRGMPRRSLARPAWLLLSLLSLLLLLTLLLLLLLSLQALRGPPWRAAAG